MSSSIVASDPNKETDNLRLYDKHLQNMITLGFQTNKLVCLVGLTQGFQELHAGQVFMLSVV